VALRLVIGNKNYSSWSLRPWIALKAAGIAFEERVVPLGDPDFKRTLGAISPAGKVPVLIDGEIHVWESLAIIEYLAEKYPDAGLWPEGVEARAHARAIAAEMHAGFAALRRECPMNMWRPQRPRELGADATANAARIDAMWTACRERFGQGGAFLFGRSFGAADAMYAPIVSRFATYGVAVGAAARAYMDAVMGLPAWQEWRKAALVEPWVLPEDEIDWPQVHRIEGAP
jgi:glutathione S-transferase